MSDEAERIRHEMQNVRQDMGQEVHGIVRGAKQLSDWKYYVRQHPWACVAGAFTLGFMATPARKQLWRGDAAKMLEHLRSSGVLPAAASGAAAPAGGVMGAVLAMAGPFVLKNAAAMLARHFQGGDSPPPTAATPSEVRGTAGGDPTAGVDAP
jgi:hypothetical protein